MHITAPQPNTVLNWLGATVVALLTVVGMLYASAYLFGVPNLPDPDRRHHINEMHKCESTRKMT